jgi:hypothetical protein
MTKFYAVKSKDVNFARYLEDHGHKFSLPRKPTILFTNKKEAEQYKAKFAKRVSELYKYWSTTNDGGGQSLPKMISKWGKLHKCGWKVVTFTEA